MHRRWIYSDGMHYKKATDDFTKKTKSLVKNVTESWSGVIPCTDCSGINYKLILNSDHTYTERRRYLEKDVKAFTETGQMAITVDSIVKIIHKEFTKGYFMFTGTQLKMLDQEAKSITSPLAEHFILKRQ